MNKKTIMYFYFNIFVLIISITEIQSITEQIIPIDSKLNDGDIIKEDYYFDETGDAYFSYNLNKFSSESNIVFTIHDSKKDYLTKLNIQCILSDSTNYQDIITEFQNKESICAVLYHSDDKLINVIASLSGYKTGLNLLLKLHSVKGDQMSIFLRENKNYYTEIKNQTITNSFAYVAFEFEPKKHYNKEIEKVLIATEANSLLICEKNNNKFTLIDETLLLLISEQSLAAHFWKHDKLIIFVGKYEYDETVTDNDIILNLVEKEVNKYEKQYYYIASKDGGLISFHYECQDDITQHYLIVNYGNISNHEYYYIAHNLIGSKSSKVDYFSQDKHKIRDLDFSEEIKRFNYLPKSDSHLQVFNLQCSGKGNKIIANIYYNRKYGNSNEGALLPGYYNYYLHNFGEKEFKMKYGDYSNLFEIEVFTPNVEEEKKFNVVFEGQNYEINNKNIYVFHITDNNTNSLTINTNEKIETIISISSDVDKLEDYDDFFTFHTRRKGDIYYQYYIANHEFNTNYYVDVEVTNLEDNIISLCYYLPNMVVLYKDSQNCFLFPAKTTQNITLEKLFVESKDNNFNLEEPRYSFILFDTGNYNYKITKIYFRTDLPKSTPIDKTLFDTYQDLKYLDTKLENNKKSYFNIDLTNSKKLNHIDLYILSDTSKYGELKLDIKCIMKYEFAISFIEHYFTEDNNICKFINKDDTHANVYHILFKNEKMDDNERFIMQITSNQDIDVKFLIKAYDYVLEKFNYDKQIYILNEQSVYTVYEIKKEDLEQYRSKNNMIVYNIDKNGIEFYAQKEDNFEQIYKGSFFILNINNILNNYADYDKFLLLLGKDDCENKFCNTKSKYEVNFIENINYTHIDEFNEKYRFPFVMNKCKKNRPVYIVFDYGKKYEKDPISLAKYVFTGNLIESRYIDRFYMDTFEKGLVGLDTYQKEIFQNDLNLSILKVTCQNNLFAYFDYFTKIETTEIQLNKGTIHYFVIKNSTNYTFNYESIDEIEISVLEGRNEPIIYFENKKKNSDTLMILIRKRDDINQFYLAAPENADLPIRVITRLNIGKLPKTQLKDLYKLDNKFIYDIPEKAINVTLYITRKSSNLRLLENENTILICYTVSNLILLDKIKGNCFDLENNYELKYTVPEDRKEDTKSYIVLYPFDDEQEINVERINPVLKDDGTNNNGNTSPKKEEDGGLSWIVILIIILLILILIGVGVFIFIRWRKKGLSSEEIEKTVKQETPMQIIN